MPTRSRSTRYILAIGALALLAVALVAAAFGLTEGERRAIQDDVQEATRIRGIALELAIVVGEQQTTLLEFVLHPGPDAAAHFEESVTAEADIAQRIGDLSGLPLAGADRTIPEILDASSEWRRDVAQPIIDEALRDGDAEAGEEVHAAVVESLIADLVGQLDRTDIQLRARQDALAGTQALATGFGLAVMVLAAFAALLIIRKYGRTVESDAQQASVLNRFTEVTSFAADDASVASSNLEALALLARPDAAVTHVLNRSKDRAIPEAVRGNAIAEVLPMHALAACPGVVRGSMYVTDDASAPLSVHCPIYPRDTGTVACVPLNSGESVGAVHLYWARPNALSLADRPAIARIAEHAALAIGNRRLLAALHGQANTDPRTGLANSRAFDVALEQSLQAMTSGSALSVLMLDLDHFKDFNDRHGHPAGDEALRAFAGVLRSCMREGDLAARYGGEEFAVLLVDVDAASALPIAERIRSRTEATIISLAPGLTDRITVSIGMASAPTNGTERVDVLRAADEALYRAKHAGRNRVMLLTDPSPAPLAIGVARPAQRSTRRTVSAAGD